MNRKYIVDKFRMDMVDEESFDLEVTPLSDEEFRMLARDAESHSKNEYVDFMLDLPYNRNTINATFGDVFLIAESRPFELKFYYAVVYPNIGDINE